MKAFASRLIQDLLLAWRNGHVAVVVGIAVLMIALIIVLPPEINTGPKEYVLDNTEDGQVMEALLQMGANPEGLTTDPAQFQALIEEHRDAIGIRIGGPMEAPTVEVIQRTAIPEETVNVLIASIDLVLESIGDGPRVEVPVERIRPQAASVPLNLAGLPVFLAFEVAILGFLLVAVFVFQEKQEGTIRAYRITPGGLWRYVASKTAVFTLLGLGYGAAVVAVGVGLSANWPAVVALTVWSAAFMTLFGLGFAVWFRNLSHWFFPGLAVLVINMVPFFSYVYPVFNPGWIQAIPSYGLLFSFREALFSTGSPTIISRTLLTGIAWLVAAGAFGALSVRARLLKGD